MRRKAINFVRNYGAALERYVVKFGSEKRTDFLARRFYDEVFERCAFALGTSYESATVNIRGIRAAFVDYGEVLNRYSGIIYGSTALYLLS